MKGIELLGLPAKDKVTGFEGVLTSLGYDLYGCVQFVITPPAKDGKILDGNWVDSNRVEITGKTKVMEVPDFGDRDVLMYDKGAADKPLM